MTRRKMFEEVLSKSLPKIASISRDILSTMEKLRILRDDMFTYPEKHEAKSIRKIRCIYRFLDKKGYW